MKRVAAMSNDLFLVVSAIAHWTVIVELHVFNVAILEMVFYFLFFSFDARTTPVAVANLLVGVNVAHFAEIIGK